MPSYEALLILKNLPRPQLATVLKRNATNIYNVRGVLFAIENLGMWNLPHIMRNHGRRFREGSYFLMRFDAPILAIEALQDEYKRDVDVIRGTIVKMMKPPKIECTLDEELKPPAYRKEVQEMIENGRRPNRYSWNPRTGLDYNPFTV